MDAWSEKPLRGEARGDPLLVDPVPPRVDDRGDPFLADPAPPPRGDGFRGDSELPDPPRSIGGRGPLLVSIPWRAGRRAPFLLRRERRIYVFGDWKTEIDKTTTTETNESEPREE